MKANHNKLEWKSTDGGYNSIKQAIFSGNEQAGCVLIVVKNYNKEAITKAVEEFSRKKDNARVYNLMFLINGKSVNISLRDVKLNKLSELLP